jgi:hypothetical protein
MEYGTPLDETGKSDITHRIEASLAEHGAPSVDKDVILWAVVRRRRLYAGEKNRTPSEALNIYSRYAHADVLQERTCYTPG